MKCSFTYKLLDVVFRNVNHECLFHNITQNNPGCFYADLIAFDNAIE